MDDTALKHTVLGNVLSTDLDFLRENIFSELASLQIDILVLSPALDRFLSFEYLLSGNTMSLGDLPTCKRGKVMPVTTLDIPEFPILFCKIVAEHCNAQRAFLDHLAAIAWSDHLAALAWSEHMAAIACSVAFLAT